MYATSDEILNVNKTTVFLFDQSRERTKEFLFISSFFRLHVSVQIFLCALFFIDLCYNLRRIHMNNLDDIIDPEEHQVEKQ